MAENEDQRTAMQRVKQITAKGITFEQRKQLYDDFGKTYDKDLHSIEYSAPDVTADTAANMFPSNREKVKILDVAAGTGLVGIKLYERGFRIMDALDYSAGMLEKAGKLGLYDKLLHKGMSAEPLDEIEADTYDCIVSAGGYGGGMAPYNAVVEMIRLVKSGGYIIIVTREYFGQYDEYMNIFIPLCDELQTQGKWTKIEISTFEKFLVGIRGQKIVYRVN